VRRSSAAFGRSIVRAIPAVAWLPSWRLTLKRDTLSALAVWALLVPQAMAYAALAGVPPVRGLYAACAGLLLYALLGTSRQLNVGPSSGLAILSAATVAPIAAGSSDRFLNLTALLALITGGLLALAGLARVGFIAEFLAKPVLAGYMVGLALVILAGQISSLLGIPSGSGNFFQLAWNVFSNLGSVSGRTVSFGLASLALILVLQRVAPKLPASLLAVVAGIIAARALDASAHGVAELGTIAAAMPEVNVPSVTFADVERLFAGAVGLALLAYAESIAAARSFAARHHYEVDANRELVALGASNIGSGLLQGFAINGSVSRTAAADGAGQRSQLAGLVNLVLVLLTLALLTPFFADLPKATLAAVVIAAVLPLLKTANLRRLYRIDKTDFAIALVCLTGVLVWGVLGGILVAIVASLVALVYRSFRPEVAVLGRSRSSETDEDIGFRDVSGHRDVETFPGLVIFRFDQEIFFANATFFRDQIRHLVESSSPRPRTILVDAAAVTHIDTTAIDVLTELHNELSAERIRLAFARIKSPVHDILTRAGLVELLGPESFYPTLESGVAAFLESSNQSSPARASATTAADDEPDSPSPA
jgi:sulfate permease, SulP family